MAASGGKHSFSTPFGLAHFASAKAPGLQLTDVQMTDALRRCKAKSWYSAAPFTGDTQVRLLLNPRRCAESAALEVLLFP